ncbi:MAG: TRAP transporter large permease subunit [Bosea sp.]|nr:TRAP transporter large permease subunit [Bosea sp. (in: a-proteobacteria)]
MSGALQHDAILAADGPRNVADERGAAALLALVNRFAFRLSAVALVAAAFVLTFGVVTGHLTKSSVLWQDEVTIFLIAGAIFLSAATVQAGRGHVGIDLLDHWFPGSTAGRRLVVDAVMLCFCLIFAWKTAMLLHEAYVDGQTSQSAWGPPLWIPYALLATGMLLLALQVAVQVATRSPLLCLAVLALAAAVIFWPRSPLPLVSGLPQWLVGVSYCVVTLLVMFSGMPIAFALGVVAVGFMVLFMPAASLDTIAQNFYEELANVIILAIPLFILKGAAIGRSNAGRDLYSALHAWLHRIPGGLGVANTIACGLFAAMAGSSPATCSAIGSAGIPEMRARGYSPGFAAGIIAAGGTLGILLPPSVTMLLYAVAAEVSLGKLFLAGIGPGLLLMLLFAGYSMLRYSKEKRLALAEATATGKHSALLDEEHYTLRQKLKMIGWVAPFVTILAGVMIVLYAGWATPSETAGVGAVLALVVIGIMYGIWRPSKVMPIVSGTLKESTMLLMIVGMSLLYAYVMSYLHISQSAAAWIIGLNLSKWVLLAAILVFVVVLGFFLPPVSIILMTAPIVLPPLKAAGFDLIWFGVVMTIVMEMGLIHPPVGLNIFVIKNIAPDIPLSQIMWGTLPFVLLITLAVVLVCLFPGLVTWLPTAIMG